MNKIDIKKIPADTAYEMQVKMASHIRGQVDKLNNLLQEGAEYGLIMEVEVRDVSVLGQPIRPMLIVTVSKEL